MAFAAPATDESALPSVPDRQTIPLTNVARNGRDETESGDALELILKKSRARLPDGQSWTENKSGEYPTEHTMTVYCGTHALPSINLCQLAQQWKSGSLRLKIIIGRFSNIILEWQAIGETADNRQEKWDLGFESHSGCYAARRFLKDAGFAAEGVAVSSQPISSLGHTHSYTDSACPRPASSQQYHGERVRPPSAQALRPRSSQSYLGQRVNGPSRPSSCSSVPRHNYRNPHPSQPRVSGAVGRYLPNPIWGSMASYRDPTAHLTRVSQPGVDEVTLWRTGDSGSPSLLRASSTPDFIRPGSRDSMLPQQPSSMHRCIQGDLPARRDSESSPFADWEPDLGNRSGGHRRFLPTHGRPRHVMTRPLVVANRGAAPAALHNAGCLGGKTRMVQPGIASQERLASRSTRTSALGYHTSLNTSHPRTRSIINPGLTDSLSGANRENGNEKERLMAANSSGKESGFALGLQFSSRAVKLHRQYIKLSLAAAAEAVAKGATREEELTIVARFGFELVERLIKEAQEELKGVE